MEWGDDWGDGDEPLTVSQEAALRAAEEQALARRAANGGSGGAVQPPLAGPAAAAAGAAGAAAAPPSAAAPAMRKRKMPAVLGGAPAPAPPGAASSGAAAPPPAPAAPAAAAADENLPPARYCGRLRYAFTPAEVDWLCDTLLQSGVAAAGFDIEWRVTYQTGVPPRPVALVQLCYREPAAAAAAAGRPPQYITLLLHIAHSGLTPALRRLLCSPDLLKVGVGIGGDAQKVMRDFEVQMSGTLCLSDYANARLAAPGPTGALAGTALGSSASSSEGGSGGSGCLPAAGAAAAAAAPAAAAQPAPLVHAPQKWSLAGLASALLRLQLEKNQGLRCSNWEARPPLTTQQQHYAATDAWASLRVYEVLSKMPVVAPPPPPLAPAAAPSSAGVPEAAAGGPMAAAADWVPACSALRHLQPAKLAVYQAVVQQGHSLAAVAAHRNIREDSVQGYLAEAIASGLGYSWSRLGVPAEALQQAAQVCSELLGRPLAWQLAAAVAGPAASVTEEEEEQQQLVCSKRTSPCSPGGLVAEAAAAATTPAVAAAAVPEAGAPQLGAAAAEAAAAGTAAAGAHSPAAMAAAGMAGAPAAACEPPEEPVDVLELLLAAGHKVRELKEQRFPDVSYGQLRLALAHLGRVNPGPWR